MGKQVEQDVFKVVGAVFAIVMIIAIARNAGGVAAILAELFGGLNMTVGTLVNAPTYQRAGN